MTVTSSFFVQCPTCTASVPHIVTDENVVLSQAVKQDVSRHLAMCPSAGGQGQALDALLSLCSTLQQQLRRKELAEQHAALQRSRSGQPVPYGRAYRQAKRARKKKAHKRRRCNIKQHRYR